ncbi:MAG: ATP-binding cassette domain-containing protein [Trueperaceae bacterium]
MSLGRVWSAAPAIPPAGRPEEAASAPPAAITLGAVAKRYGRHLALDRVDLRIDAGTTVALTGANGAGKSTLLGLISGTVSPSSGRVTLAGARPGDGSRARGRILGVLHHRTMLYDRLTGSENLRLHATVRGLPLGRVDAVLAQVDLGDAAHRPVATYSHGMRKRLSLARLLLHEPAVLLLDEPFAGLDAASQERLAQIVEGLRGRHTIVFSTHDLPRAAALADRVLTLAAGRIADDRPTEVQPGSERPAVEAAAHPAPFAPAARAAAVAGFVRTVAAMLTKDLRIESRARSVSTAMLMLAGLLAVVLGMAFEPLANDPAVLSGALWVLITFAALHGLARSFDAEFHDDALRGLLLTGADPAAIYLGKVLGTATFLFGVALASVGLISLFFGAPALLGALPGLLLLIALAALGLTAVGGLTTVMARHSGLGETLLPLLLLPLVVPVLLAGVASVPVLLETGRLDPGWLRVLLAYDVGMLVATTAFFEHLLEG